jgi:hypothetical protein
VIGHLPRRLPLSCGNDKTALVRLGSQCSFPVLSAIDHHPRIARGCESGRQAPCAGVGRYPRAPRARCRAAHLVDKPFAQAPARVRHRRIRQPHRTHAVAAGLGCGSISAMKKRPSDVAPSPRGVRKCFAQLRIRTFRTPRHATATHRDPRRISARLTPQPFDTTGSSRHGWQPSGHPELGRGQEPARRERPRPGRSTSHPVVFRQDGGFDCGDHEPTTTPRSHSTTERACSR